MERIHIESLDGVRAIAVSIVFLAHGGLQKLVPGGLGVTVFFVLSGYLITTLMRLEHARRGTLDLPAFYLRRAVRLMPPLLIALLLALAIYQAGLVHSAPTKWGIFSVLFYGGNYYAIAHQFQGMPAGLGVTWSLAVEEHFYIIFPALALLLLPRLRVAPLLVLCASILAWRCWLAIHVSNADHVEMATDTRVDSILIGCIMALRFNPIIDPIPAAAIRHSAAIGTIAIGTLLATLIYRNEFFRLTFRYTVQALTIAPLLYLAVVRPQARPYRWLNERPVEYLGRISYMFYLCHQTILFVVTNHWPDLGMAGTMALAAALTLAVAVPVRAFVEKPLAALHRRWVDWKQSMSGGAPMTG